MPTSANFWSNTLDTEYTGLIELVLNKHHVFHGMLLQTAQQQHDQRKTTGGLLDSSDKLSMADYIHCLP